VSGLGADDESDFFRIAVRLNGFISTSGGAVFAFVAAVLFTGAVLVVFFEVLTLLVLAVDWAIAPNPVKEKNAIIIMRFMTKVL
jgi:hypothetical protein